MGAQIDGYPVMVATTVVVPATATSAPTKISVGGDKARALAAARFGLSALLRTLRPGTSTSAVAPLLAKVCEAMGVRPVAGMLSHRVGRGRLDSPDGAGVVMAPAEGQRKAGGDFDVEVGHVYAVDVLVSTGDAKVDIVECRVWSV